jgi:hypothetical protein
MLEDLIFFPTGSLRPLAILNDGLNSIVPFRCEVVPSTAPEAAAARLGDLFRLLVPLKAEIIC